METEGKRRTETSGRERKCQLFQPSPMLPPVTPAGRARAGCADSLCAGSIGRRKQWCYTSACVNRFDTPARLAIIYPKHTMLALGSLIRPMDRGGILSRDKQRGVRRRIVRHLPSNHAVRKAARTRPGILHICRLMTGSDKKGFDRPPRPRAGDCEGYYPVEREHRESGQQAAAAVGSRSCGN